MCVRSLPRCGGCGAAPGFAHAVGGKVEWNSKVLVFLNGGSQPLLAVFGEVPVCEERRSEWNVGFGWSQVAVVKCFVDDV